jgi:hypothetical protein
MGKSGKGDGVTRTVGVARGGGGAERRAPVAINDARPTTRTTAPSDSSVLYRLMPLLIIDARPSKSGNGSGRGQASYA